MERHCMGALTYKMTCDDMIKRALSALKTHDAQIQIMWTLIHEQKETIDKLRYNGETKQ
jgi:hypothetical protein